MNSQNHCNTHQLLINKLFYSVDDSNAIRYQGLILGVDKTHILALLFSASSYEPTGQVYMRKDQFYEWYIFDAAEELRYAVGRHSGRTEKQILEDEAVMQAFYHGRPFDPFGIKMGGSKNDK